MSRILIVDDEPNIVRIVSLCLQQAGFLTIGVTSGEDAMRLLKRESIDLMITDMRMGHGMDGLTLLQAALHLHRDLPVIMITAYGTVELAVDAMKEGACDFIRKPFKMEELLATVQGVLERRRPAAPIPGAAPGATTVSRHYGLLVGESPEMQRVYDWIERVAKTDATALIEGESGTGKELVAQAIHRCSRRAAGPWVPLNCAALPPSLLESEMFGHAAGAFTGATTEKDGLFIAAHGGTLFMDEIGTMDLGIQSKVLRALQERKMRRVGQTDDILVDTRVIAATNEPLEEKKNAGLFREDLFYRISVIPIVLPPLRHRVADIPVLAQHFLAEQSQALSRDLTLTPDVLEALRVYSWPGNVRELHNAIACAAALCEGGDVRMEDLPPRVARHGERHGAAEPLADIVGTPRSLRDFLRDKEKEYMDAILRHTGGNRARAAELLGISRATFYRKLGEDVVGDDPGAAAAGV